MSNKIGKNKGNRGQVEDIEMAEQVATQSTDEFEPLDYVAQPNGSLQTHQDAEGEKSSLPAVPSEMTGHIPTSEEILQMAKNVEPGRLDLDRPGPTSSYKRPTTHYKRPTTPYKRPTTPKHSTQPKPAQPDVPPEVEQVNALQNKLPETSQQLVPYSQKLPKEQTRAVAVASEEEEQVLNVEEQRQPADIGDVQPKPQDEAECQQWLQQTSQILTSQYKSLLREDRYQVGIGFEDEIEKESTLQENGSQRSHPSMLDTFEDICEETTSEHRDPQAKTLRSKWVERFGEGSRRNLCRKLDTKLPTARSQLLLRFNIMSQRKRKTLETLTFRIELKYSRHFCTLHLNQTIDLKSAASKLQRFGSLYKNHIDVLQKYQNHHQYSELCRISWLWPNGTLTTINGCHEDKRDLIDVQEKLLAPILNVPHFKAAPGHNAQYLRLRSTANFGFNIDLKKFGERYVLSTHTCRDYVSSQYVYYVTSEIPGVVAKLHDHGHVYVYAMTIQEADNLLIGLYRLICNHRIIE
ncbi:uncharacterized protein LOC117591389 isoform X2 [Drosophila guanche]|nr:uncharacterized protein LOC117591389 isoform X2 [Drosophila guanche]